MISIELLVFTCTLSDLIFLAVNLFFSIVKLALSLSGDYGRFSQGQ